MNKKNIEIGKLIWERQLFEVSGNCAAIKRIDDIIHRVRELARKEIKEDERYKNKVAFAGM